MIVPSFSTAVLLSLGFATVSTAFSPEVMARDSELARRANNKSSGTNNNKATTTTAAAKSNSNSNSNSNVLALNPANVQSGSDSNGLAATSASGQAASATDPANFINFCTGKTLTNGDQVQGGSCNGIVMGDIPSTANMVSTIIVSPQPGQDIPANTDFNVEVQVANLQAGSFTNPDDTYYAAPQALASNGQIIGHTHVTIQDMGGSMTPSQALPADVFAFFKGINNAGNGNGLLTAAVTGGLPAGVYRVCTMASSSNHQPVLMPVAQRGAQDDCTKFTVGGGGSSSSSASNTAKTTKAAAAASTSTAAAKGGKGKTGKTRARRSWFA
ncbi:Pathogenicity cluster 5 protein d [Rhizina undulata]